jgi:hypothetical protein
MFNRSFLRRKKISQLPQSFFQYSAGAANDVFGISSALSSDGTTAIVGQYGDISLQGTAVVFIRSGKTWTEQALLSQSGGAASDNFGTSVGLSDDGNTAICGVPYRGATDTGAAVVFTRSGATWTQQAVLTYSAAAANDLFGYSVSLSSDGNMAICGSPTSGSGNGRSVVFTRSGATWTEQAVLTHSVGAAGAYFGWSVKLSTDGSTAIVGAKSDSSVGSVMGSAVIFTRSGVTWTQQTTLRYSAAANNDQLGYSVSLSSDGNTAIVGSPNADPAGVAQAGLAVVFTRSGATWTEQAALKYSAAAVNDFFGVSVSLSGNGNMALCGAYGGNIPVADAGIAIMFTRNNGVWVQESVLSYSSGVAGDAVGFSVALSRDGNIGIAGAPGIGTDVGGAIVFYNH